MSEKYRISFVPAADISSHSYQEEFVNLETAKAVLNSIANYTLLLHEKRIMPDYSNFGFIEVFEDGEWTEIEDED